VSGDVAAKIAVYDEKIKTAKENIEANRRQLKQMDDAVDQIMGRSTSEQGADKSNAVRRSQQKDRAALAKDIEANQKLIASLNEERAPIAAEVRKVEAEVGPIKYIAALIYGDNPDANLLEKSVVWVILTIVFVFDPLAVLLLLASQMSFQWLKEDPKDKPPEEPVSTEPGPKPGPKPEPYRPNFKKTKFEYKGSWPNKKPKMEEPMAAIIPDPVVEPKIESVELVASSDLTLNEVDTKFWNMVEDNVKTDKEQWLADLPEDKEKKEEILKEVGLLTAVDEPIKSKTQTPDEDNLESEKKK
jgi:hypothetical protein